MEFGWFIHSVYFVVRISDSHFIYIFYCRGREMHGIFSFSTPKCNLHIGKNSMNVTFGCDYFYLIKMWYFSFLLTKKYVNSINCWLRFERNLFSPRVSIHRYVETRVLHICLNCSNICNMSRGDDEIPDNGTELYPNICSNIWNFTCAIHI